MPHSDDLAGTAGQPRNRLQDPFSVRYNRETSAGEIMLTYDPTPATWMWGWDSDVREDASLAASMGFIYKRHHTTADAGLFISDTNNIYAFAGGTPARDLWEVNCRIVNRFGRTTRMISHIYFGKGEPNGDNVRLIFPLQVMADISFTLGTPRWFDFPQTRFGVRGTIRTLDRYSNRYQPEGYQEPELDELYPEDAPEGREWEIRTYLHLVI